MASNAAETLIGAFVLAAAGGFLVYAANTADISVGERDGYEVVAKFRKAEGVAVGGDVRMAGVKIGTISGMSLDTETYQAVVTLSLQGEVQLPEDSSAKITSASLLGDSYVALDAGASEFMLADGDEIEYTQGSVSVGDLIGRFVAGSAGTE